MSHPSFSESSKVDRILVVDDSPDNVLLIETILQEEGYEITTADNGYSALSQISELPPDLVLLDIMMPEMDGYEVTRHIRENIHLPFIPILLITAHDSPSVVQGLDIGADDFIRKPVEIDELLARVRSLLRLKHSVDERDKISRQREDFVSRLTHDLRTPLVAADRMLGLMQEGAMGPISPAMKDAFVIMQRSNQNLLTMVNNLLEVYRYEAGRKTLNFSAIDLRDLIEEIVEELSPLGDVKGLALKIDTDGQATKTPSQGKSKIMGDRLELRRLLTNLIGNAIKFTDVGEVDIFIDSQKYSNGDGSSALPTVTIKIQDTGPGISPEEKAMLFERFRPGKNKKSDMGLGLHLCKLIVEAHKGTLDVKSELGQGSTFIVRLPTLAAGNQSSY